jgi:TatD DNase family protein
LQAELDGIVNPGCDAETSAFAVELAEKYDFIYAAVGWHPENLKGMPANYLDMLAAWAVHPKVVAIGEIGLDYYWKENEPKEVQKRVFLEQIDIAKQFGLPIIIHDRDAHGDMLEIFQKEVTGVEAVFHCYSGSVVMAKELAKRGYYFGFGGTSTYKNAEKVREVMKYVPRELILFETDSPYLTPVPYRGKRNNPGYVEFTARNAAEVLGMDFEELAAITSANVKRLFKKIK